jgi:hypothetical protein
MGSMKKSMVLIAGVALGAATSCAQAGDFDNALRNELLANHRRDVPAVSISGNNVTLTYRAEEEWTKSSARDEVAMMDALDCLKQTTRR